jgi:hypothetical protein
MMMLMMCMMMMLMTMLMMVMMMCMMMLPGGVRALRFHREAKTNKQNARTVYPKPAVVLSPLSDSHDRHQENTHHTGQNRGQL